MGQHLTSLGCGCQCPCLDGLEKLRRSDEQKREDFERTVSFLASVPLFARQLPRSELPKAAQSLRRRVWKPGQRLVRQGEIGQALFLIQDGEATVASSRGPGEPEQVRATLCPGDYFGGHTLMTERPNVASIIAKGPGPLVTLCMSRQAFEDSGLKSRLRFPKRPAVYQCDNDDGDLQVKEELSQEEKDFIRSAIQRNGNLRALLEEASDETLEAIAAGAERRKLPQGKVLAGAGTVGHELFIVRRGSIQAFIPETRDSGGNQSAEVTLAHSTMAERLLRKEQFLQELFSGPSPRQRICEGKVSPCRRRSECQDRRSYSHDLTSEPSETPARWRKSSAESVKALCTWDKQMSREMVMQSPSGRRSSGRQPKQGTKTTSRDSFSFTSRDSFSLSVESTKSLQSPRAVLSADRLVSRRKSTTSMSDAASLSPKGRLTRKISLAGGEQGVGGRYVTFGEGESFGECSLVYNVKQEAMYMASADCEIYAIERRHFTKWFCGRSQRFHEYSKFLEEVYALSQLLSTERWELACQAQSLVEFRPGERVLSQAKPREARLWYLIWSGSAVVTYTATNSKGEEQTTKLADLYRSGHFGERSLLRGEEASQVTVDAGPHGVCCLTFDGETVLPILREIFHQANNLCPSPTVDIKEWCRTKNHGWERQNSNGWERQISTGSSSFGVRMSSKDGSTAARYLELDDLIHVCVLGRGSFGQVVLTEDPQSATRYALKMVSKGHVQRKRAERQIKWERELLTMLDSSFIIAMHKTFHDEQHVYFLLEAALGGSLLEVIHLRSEVLMEDQPHGHAAAFYVGCIVLALQHMHERRIVHRDIKPENVLLDCRGYAKVCDMGFARFVLGKTNTRVGTPEYMAPEMIDFPHTHDMSVDWWSLGVLTFELLAGQSPWEDEGISDPAERVLAIRQSQKQGRFRFPFHFPQLARSFVKSLLLPVRNRLGAVGGVEEVRGHKMFKAAQMDFDRLSSRSMQTPYVPREELSSIQLSEGEDLSQCTGDSIFSHYKEDGKDSEWDAAF